MAAGYTSGVYHASALPQQLGPLRYGCPVLPVLSYNNHSYNHLHSTDAGAAFTASLASLWRPQPVKSHVGAYVGAVGGICRGYRGPM